MEVELTTGEIMVLELVLARCAERNLDTWTLNRRLWIRPQLDELQGRGLLQWVFDEDANFKVTLTEKGQALQGLTMSGTSEIARIGIDA